MTLREIIADANEFSKQASANTRWLAAGGIAIVWTLSKGEVRALRQPLLLLPAVAFALALLADYLHYASATRRLAAVIDRCRLAGVGYDSPVELTAADVSAPRWFGWKTQCLVFAFILLVAALVLTVFPEVAHAIRRGAAYLTRTPPSLDPR